MKRYLGTSSILGLLSLALVACGGESDEPAGNNGSGGSQAGGNSSGGSAGTSASGGSAGTSSSGGSGGSSQGGSGGLTGSAQCFEDIQDGIVYWDYDQYDIVTAAHCKGTQHQQIEGVERIVFLGDSIMNGTAPTPSGSFVRTQLDKALKERFPGATSQSCAVNGQRNRDLLDGQIPNCFSDASVREAKTLTLIISGGNDLAALAKDKPSLDESRSLADGYVAQLRGAVEWLKDADNFPNGNEVVFANVYEYTDTSAELESCPAASLGGLTGTWLNGAAVLARINEGYAKIAADTGTDMVFMMESFCGHGYRRDRSDLQCYRGAGAELWFDLTCIHPNATGHTELAKAFMSVISGDSK